MIREWNSKTIREAILTNSTPRAKFERVRKHARQVMLHSGQSKKCMVCGFDVAVEVCHIKGIAEFAESTTLGVVNASDNLIYLCPNHHTMMDSGHDILGAQLQVEATGLQSGRDGLDSHSALKYFDVFGIE